MLKTNKYNNNQNDDNTNNNNNLNISKSYCVDETFKLLYKKPFWLKLSSGAICYGLPCG